MIYKLKSIAIYFLLIIAIRLCVSFTAVADNNILSISLKPKEQNNFKFGELTKTLCSIKNLSEKPIVVLNIEPITVHGEDAITLSSNAYGSVRELENEDAYEYSGMAQQATSMAFYNGFLLPNQEIKVLFDYRPLSTIERFRIKFVITKDKYDGTAKSLSPFRVYILDTGDVMNSIFRPFDESAWFKICKTTSEVTQVGPGISRRSILIPQLSKETKSLTVEVPITFENDGFFADSAKAVAAKIVNSSPENMLIAYSQVLEGYIVFEEKFSWLLKYFNQSTRGKFLPLFQPTMLKDVDLYGSVRIRIGDKQAGFGPDRHDAGWSFWDNYPVSYGDGMYTRGEFIQIHKTDLLEFLEKVKEKRGEIKEHAYFFRSRYFILELP